MKKNHEQEKSSEIQNSKLKVTSSGVAYVSYEDILNEPDVEDVLDKLSKFFEKIQGENTKNNKTSVE